VTGLWIEPLDRGHATDQSSSGVPELDRWLQRHALQADAAGTARTYVLVEGDAVLGHYALAAGSVRRSELPARHAAGTPRHPIGVILLARLAVDRRHHGSGLGAVLLADAAQRAFAAAEVIGARAVIVHASDERAAAFYEHFGFVHSPSDPLHLAVLIKDLNKTFGPPPRQH
jgi:GNAT superfamily N-acetyltransferase